MIYQRWHRPIPSKEEKGWKCYNLLYFLYKSKRRKSSHHRKNLIPVYHSMYECVHSSYQKGSTFKFLCHGFVVVGWSHMCCDPAESVWSREHWLRDIARKRYEFVFYCSLNPSIGHNFGITGPIQVGFSAKCTIPLQMSTSVK